MISQTHFEMVCNPTQQNIDNFALPFRTWHVVFVQDCNLRCAYCSTGFGSFGQKKGYMNEAVWRRLTDFALSSVPESMDMRLEFGGGETCLHYDSFLRFVDHIISCGAERGIAIEVSLTTNGLLLDEEKLDELAKRRISVTFSIDGPKLIHDRCRTDKNGKGSHEVSLKNWQYYRKLSINQPERPACAVQSVISQNVRLADMISFWQSQDQPIFSTVVQVPSTFLKDSWDAEFRCRQESYLKDLERWAMKLAKQSSVPGFLSTYSGPTELFEMWERILIEEKPLQCGAGEDTIAVNSHGDLYPCEGFIGNSRWCIGTVFNGISAKRLACFLKARNHAVAACSGCRMETVCLGSCIGANLERSIMENFQDGCWFAERMAKIGLHSYEVLSRGED